MFSSLKSRYERRNPLAVLSMAIADALGWLLCQICPLAPTKVSNNLTCKKILLVNPAHIGDVVISTAVIRRIKAHDPTIKIGFVVGSWARMVLDGHPGIDQLYVVDYWMLNRSSLSKFKKRIRYLKSWIQARHELASDGYDVAVLLNSYAPNLSSLIWAARIPVRLAYVSAGLTTLCNKVLPKPSSLNSEQSIQLKLADALEIKGESRTWLEAKALSSLNNQALKGLSQGGYVVLHPGTGNSAKLWPEERWNALIKQLCEKQVDLVITGQGQKELEMAARLAHGVRIVNLANKLNWAEWVSVLNSARLVVGADSAVGHVTVALDRPFCGIYSGIGAVSRWSPTGKQVDVLTKSMPCSPCHTRPCEERACLLSVTVEQVLSKILDMVSKH